MTFPRCLYYLLVMMPAVAFGADDSDAVNERIPVSRAEMELHWQVDCAGSWKRLAQVAGAHRGEQACELAPDLVLQLQLCGFIYQPPGSPAAGACPDYQAAHTAAGQGDCHALGLLLESAGNCLH